MNIAIIGGGAAGMMAAASAAICKNNVFLIEKNNKFGKKLRITGKGRCNITNSCPPDELIKNVPTNGRFLYSAFNTFSNNDLISFVEKMGVKTKIERGNRVFPESDSANEVADAFVSFLKKHNVTFVKASAKEINTENGKVTGVLLDTGKILSAEAVILATGGVSYTVTGSTGEGHIMAEKLGHTVTELKPSLVPIECEEKWVQTLQGLSLKNVTLKVLNQNGKEIYSDFGEMLFTHFGISGPIVLSASSHMKDAEGHTIHIDLKPALSLEELDKRLIRDFEKYSKKDFVNSLDDLFPKKLIDVMVELSGIDPHKKTGEIGKSERKNFASLIKNLTLTASSFRPINEAIITSGGIKVSEINPKTMESKIVSGLYFAGEIIDVDAYTGGFNLQIAFSTGFVAGRVTERE